MTTDLVVVARQHRFVVRELSGQNARNQQSVADLEEQMALVLAQNSICASEPAALESFSTSSIAFFGTSTFTSPFSPASFVIRLRQAPGGGHPWPPSRPYPVSGSAIRRSGCSAILPWKSQILSWQIRPSESSQESSPACAASPAAQENFLSPFRLACISSYR